MIQHMVLLKFREDVAQEAIDDCFADLAELQNKIDGITYFRGGPYSSPEGFNKGFTHGFLMTFDTAENRDIYLPHPEHEKVKAKIMDLTDDALAFDFEVYD